MVLSNKERQARYRARLKELAAAAAGLTEERAELLISHRAMIAEMDQQIAMFESGAISFPNGSTLTKDEALDRACKQRAQLQALVEKYDPDGLTAVDRCET